MSLFTEKHIVSLVVELLGEKGVLSRGEMHSDRVSVEPISSDGSTRRFWRFSVGAQPLCIVVAPLTTSEAEIKESRSAWYIGTHLFQKGCSVPEIFGWHEDSGMLAFEDLGNERLHGVVVPGNGVASDLTRIREHYCDVIARLAKMQVEGVLDFDSSWCWDGDCYNQDLMLKRESGYFLDAFWSGLLQQTVPEGIHLECEHLSEIAASAPARYFLHRDFQSRNIMIAGGGSTFIDFQGGRLGPLAYDLASLLIDPYTALSYSLQEEFEEVYMGEITKYIELEPAVFRNEFHALALQRNLQIIGAFSFLSQVRGKSFFSTYLQPALQSARYRLGQPLFADLPIMRKMIDQGLNLL
ncbi:MAG: aminoglycoside/choline kinase family phosphotransferase [Desulforhopalus sp.]|jgi:aminoglycoside/choline kinase family phosphotransferase